MSHALCLALAILAADDRPATPLGVAVPDRSAPVSYAGEIAEILGETCLGCHNAARAEGELDMEEVAGLLTGGSRGPAIVPGKAGESLLFLLASHQAEPAMPPAKEQGIEPLNPEQLGLLKLWIDAGALDDSAETPSPPASLTLGPLPPGVRPIVALDITPDGRRVAVGRGNRVVIHDVETGARVASLGGHDDIVQSVRFDPEGRRLAAGGFRIVTLWDVPDDDPGSWPPSTVLGPHADRVLALDFRPDGLVLAAGGGEPSRSGEIKLWALDDGGTARLARDLDGVHADTVFGLRFSPDGSKLATAGADRLVRLVDLEGDGATRTFEGHTHHVLAVDRRSDGRQLASAGADGAVKLWDVQTGEQGPTLTPIDKPLTALRWIDAGPTLAGASADGKVRLWTVPADDRQGTESDQRRSRRGREVRTLPGSTGYLFALAASKDGKVIAAGGANGILYLWDANGEGRLIRQIGPED